MPLANGATYVPDQPETSYYGVAGRRPAAEPARTDQPANSRQPAPPTGRPLPRADRGLPGWMAVLLLIAVAGVGGIIDSASGSAIRGAFNYGLVLASLIAILVVKRGQMFSVVIAPPLVYFVASAGLLYIRTGGLHNRGKLLDAATNWVVYGFPAIAGATAVVLVVAGIRLVIRR
jgi:predicted lipid-binding transport protein (Tim44 family)